MNNLTKESLERRFQALKEYKDDTYYFVFIESDYIDYICRNKITGDIIQKLFFDGQIYKATLELLLRFYMGGELARAIDRKSKPQPPSFMSKSLEKELGLYKAYFKTLKEVVIDEVEETKKEFESALSTQSFSSFSEKELKDDLYNIQKLHNLIMDSLEKMDKDESLPFKIKETEDYYTVITKANKKMSFKRGAAKCRLAEYIFKNYNEDNIYYNHKANKYVQQHCPSWKGKLSELKKDINDRTGYNQLIIPEQKGKAFSLNLELIE